MSAEICRKYQYCVLNPSPPSPAFKRPLNIFLSLSSFVLPCSLSGRRLQRGLERNFLFRSHPIHFACLKGDLGEPIASSSPGRSKNPEELFSPVPTCLGDLKSRCSSESSFGPSLSHNSLIEGAKGLPPADWPSDAAAVPKWTPYDPGLSDAPSLLMEFFFS